MCFLPPGEILKSGVGITCWVPINIQHGTSIDDMAVHVANATENVILSKGWGKYINIYIYIYRERER